MQHRWTRKQIQHKWTMKDALDIHGMELQRLKLPERAELANFLQGQFRKRVASFRRAKNYSNPYAYLKLMEDFEALKQDENYQFDFNSPILQTRGRNRMLSSEYASLSNPAARLMTYIVNMQEFFRSKSSTVSGWRDIIRNESMKLFGYKTYKTKRGERIVLNHLMTEEERIHFWRLYEELRKSGSVAIYDSESMRSTGFTRIWQEKQSRGEWDYDDLTSMMNQMLDSMRASGIPVRDIPEHKPGVSSDPIALDLVEEEDSIEFQW